MADAVEITISSHPRWLRLIRQVVLEFAQQAGFDRADSQDITLAVGEAAGNVIKHSYKGRTDRTFSVACSVAEGGLEVEIRDQGEPFEPADHTPRPPDELRAGGRGLYLMRAIMDRVEYDHLNGANIIRMRKSHKAAACEPG